MRSVWVDGKRRDNHEERPRNELISSMSGTEKRQVAEVVEFSGIAGVWVLIMKNHKIQPEELEL